MLVCLRVIGLLLSLSFLGGCAVLEIANPITAHPTPDVLTPQLAERRNVQTSPADAEILPATVATQVKEQLSQEIGATSLKIERYKRETWSDGCLGLGGPAESCLAALTEGWQIEIVDTATNLRYIYRTNLNGDNIRRSTLDEE